jgi:hypothetical protein
VKCKISHVLCNASIAGRIKYVLPFRSNHIVLGLTYHTQHFFAYPIAVGKWANVGGFVTRPEDRGTSWDEPWVAERPAQELAAHFAEWESDIQDVTKVSQ